MARNDPEYQKAYRLKNREKNREYQLRYCAEHRDIAKARAIAWYHQNKERHAEGRKRRYDPEAAKEYNRQYRIKHAERLRAHDKQRDRTERRKAQFAIRRALPKQSAAAVARAKAWAIKNPERHKQLAQNVQGRRRARIAGAAHESIDMRIVIERSGRKCGICGKRVRKAEYSLDHIVPVAKGGAHILSNVQLAHLSCNKRKGAKHLHAQPFIDF